MQNNKWIFCPKPQQEARLRLFCFPYAGGGASVFSGWSNHISPEIEICAIKLPGREGRFNEEPYRRITELVKKLASEIAHLLSDKTFAFFGHSVGARICFELTRYLRRNNMPCPKKLIVSAARAPDNSRTSTLDHKMDNEEFLKRIMEIEGIPDELKQNKELLDLVLPIIKADTEMLNTYEYIQEDPLNCSIAAYCGNFDPIVSMEDASEWREHTRSNFTLSMVPGGHFFIRNNLEQFIEMLVKDLKISRQELNLMDTIL